MLIPKSQSIEYLLEYEGDEMSVSIPWCALSSKSFESAQDFYNGYYASPAGFATDEGTSSILSHPPHLSPLITVEMPSLVPERGNMGHDSLRFQYLMEPVEAPKIDLASHKKMSSSSIKARLILYTKGKRNRSNDREDRWLTPFFPSHASS